MNEKFFGGKKFEYCFPIGDGCNMAAALSRTGLRGYSGPFDWIICEIEDVMRLVENHFEDFLNPDYLVDQPIPFNEGQCGHTKYPSLLFVHDFDPDRGGHEARVDQIAEIAAKYQRRIDNFYACIKKPTVFFHFEFNGRIEYWKENYQKVSNFFKQFNPENEVVVVAYGDPAQSPDIGFPYFFTQSDKDDHFLGYYIESNQQLSDWMHDPELIPYRRRMANLRFFIDKQLGVNREISMNELRISRDKLKSEQEIWKDWVKAAQKGCNAAKALKQNGMTRIGIFGYNSFYETLVDMLREQGIEPEFVNSWYVRGQDEVYGVPTFDPFEQFDNETDEQRKEREEKEKEMEMEDRERAWAMEFAAIPRFAEIDALLCIDIEDEHWLGMAAQYMPCKVITVKQLAAGEI